MLPATLALEVKKQVLHYLGATFQMRLPETEKALQDFFNDPENGLFKGPWVQIKRPFRLADDHGSVFFNLPVPFLPFKHQWKSWKRLSSKNNTPQHTLVTTGTGSGKTECFLYPLLDHCLRQHNVGKRDGIKAIVLYPMNALAADQAGRFAEEILKSNLLSYEHNGKRIAKIRVGLYTGRMGQSTGKEEGAEPGTYKEVTVIKTNSETGKESYTAITNRASMQKDPPDILLTNYKMLDYLLLRPKDQDIWRFNQQDVSLLQYLVLDELHTYDGAQGADVACLLRRLKSRLALPQNQLCVIGTSATIAGGDDETNMDPIDRLCDFAQNLFEEKLDKYCVITEDRLNIEEITRPPAHINAYPPAELFELQKGENASAFAQRVAGLLEAPQSPVSMDDPWLTKIPGFDKVKESIEKLDDTNRWGIALGEWIRHQPLFHHLLELTQEQVISWNDLVQQLGNIDFLLRNSGNLLQRGQLLMAFLALVAQSKELRSGKAFPLVPTQVQFWLRELRRIGSVVSSEPCFSWLDEPVPDRKQLPVIHCTECGEIGWAALHNPDMDSVIQSHGCTGFELRDDVSAIYDGWGFESHAPSQRLVILSPWHENDASNSDNAQLSFEATQWHLAPGSLVVRMGPGTCPLTDEKTFPVKLVHETRQKENGQHIGVRKCPHCHSEDSLMFIGSRAATVASVAIDEVFGSVLNNDPKLLAFTDSVQDASHRAGFFSARTYHFTLRTALQHIIDDAGDTGVPLNEVGERLLDYWSQPLPGRPGKIEQVISTLLPPDLREYSRYLAFRDNPTAGLPAKLRKEFVTRLNWQATSEFSLMLTHGRTMELHASATMGWDDTLVSQTIMYLHDRFPAISPTLTALDDISLRRWIFGILHRQRERGGVYHEYLQSYAAQNLWGKFGWRGQDADHRETYPPRGRYTPRLLVTSSDKQHDFALAPPRAGNQLPWQLVWARRTLALPSVDDATLIDLIEVFLHCATQAGLLKCVHEDGNKAYYAISDRAARLYPKGIKLQCPNGGHKLFRPAGETEVWLEAPSLSYRDEHGRYQVEELNDREIYYRERYRKGALRRVFAYEHTGLLTTEERENLELSFNAADHADDPNVLTATSTLEMGIDIGDLSTTMLCSIPPSTASYLQRIGRAGRKTGTALVLSVINQRPHDLFFFARPHELLCGDVEPPGCWLDASAVLVRQYLAFCFDQGVRYCVLTDIPATGKQLVDEMIINKAGHIPNLLAWILKEEARLQQEFLARFSRFNEVREDTRLRFLAESKTENLRERIEQAASEFQLQRQLLQNAQNRLKDQKAKLDFTVDTADLAEIEREEKILKARRQKLGQITCLEVLTEHGLLPNYAFPERGVRFSGSTYYKHNKKEDTARPSIELVRAASSAIRELAPGNHFYTHSHKYDIQQLEVGSRSHQLIEKWAICGECGHMHWSEEVDAPDAVPACPQCGYDGPTGQCDRGQHKEFLPMQRSQAISYMEFYESLSADRGEERDNETYAMAISFDQTLEQPNGAVGEDTLPFGIEYRSAMLMREVNTGYASLPPELNFGANKKVPSLGFEVCAHCGMAVLPGKHREDVRHRRSCSGLRETLKRKREGKAENAFEWKTLYLYRELRSEAIRLMLPDVEQEDLDTLEAAIYLGMRLRFQGDPTHLMVKPQIVPDHSEGISRHYLVLLDAVPGGTGFLKEMFQDNKDGKCEIGEGVMQILQLALNALETCSCRKLKQTGNDTDGCYRCIRTYHMQHRADNISRERGIGLLRQLIEAGSHRKVKKALDEVKITSIFGSVLEKRFIATLQLWVEDIGTKTSWRSTVIAGTQGFEFSLGDGRLWSIELQPMLTSFHNVSVKCQPDFMLRCDDPSVKPVVIFTDGFEPHVKPGEPYSRLADDFKKRRAILESEQFHVWSITWNDLDTDPTKSFLSFLQPNMVQVVLPAVAANMLKQGHIMPDITQVCANPMEQMKAFIRCPDLTGWRTLAQQTAGLSLLSFAVKGIGQDGSEMDNLFTLWSQGYSIPAIDHTSKGDWVWLNRIGETEDLLAYAYGKELILHDYTNLKISLRLDDSEAIRSKRETYLKRWRQCLAIMNLFQFAQSFIPFATSEFEEGTAPIITPKIATSISSEWQDVLDNTLPSLIKLVKSMAAADKAVPEVEFYNDDLAEELYAELAWPEASPPIAILWGDQTNFCSTWQDTGWKVITDRDIKVKGGSWLLSQLPEEMK
ncbi:DEAD/DEAH box helicase [uncultured Photobacterium sp.]|uniref:DEAD/DEAH box helicase n=1 Tax=uncultured Photobacterium sp. TaxID=173973 RepID=UPI0026259873|nr:DEAD/DEAH box helicase [uncultured Photobacterium sp.]